ncbi:MAG: O-antigen ligase family protein [Bacteroidetes bacterium]|nr:O-antigen ligase family protein [Bacteroidota bacterium]
MTKKLFISIYKITLWGEILNKELNIRFHFLLTSLLAFLLPIYPGIIPTAIALLFINWLASGNFVYLFRKNKNSFYFLLFISLYLLYVIGLFYSENYEYGLKDLEIKLSLLVFPLIYFSSDKFKKEQLKSVFRKFIYGCLTASAICIGYATYQYFITQYTISKGIWAWDYGINFFLKDRLSLWMHPSYRSMYFVMALTAIYLLKEKEQYASFLKKYFTPAILAALVLFFNSKAGILSLLLFGAFVSWQLIFKEKKIKFAVVGIIISVLLFVSLYFSAPEFTIRVKSIFNIFSENIDMRKSEESTASRIAIWNAAKTVIAENFFIGTGTGDVKDALTDEYSKQGMTFALKEDLNAHNQFLQSFTALGIIGFISLCSSLLIPLFMGWKNKNYVYVIFILIIILNLFTESMFETQAGVVFYAFFNSLLLFSQPAPNETSGKEKI